MHSFLLMGVLFTYHLGLNALLTTVIVCGCTMLYLVIQQQHSINQMQKSLCGFVTEVTGGGGWCYSIT